MSTFCLGNSGTKLFCSNTGKYTMFSFFPDIIFVSTYTGYTGSVIATLLFSPNISTIFPQSHFAPSDTNISSNSIPKSLYSFSIIAFLKNSYPCSGPYPLKPSEVPISSTALCIASITAGTIGFVTSPIPNFIIFFSGLLFWNSATFFAIVENK